jgi:hypothetical protein
LVGGCFYSPIKSDNDHYKTFLELYQSNVDYSRPAQKGNGDALGYCDECQCWAFFNKVTQVYAKTREVTFKDKEIGPFVRLIWIRKCEHRPQLRGPSAD